MNPDFYRGKPRVERVILKFVGNAGLTELLAGNVDITSGDLVLAAGIARDQRFRVSTEFPTGYWRSTGEPTTRSFGMLACGAPSHSRSTVRSSPAV